MTSGYDSVVFLLSLVLSLGSQTSGLFDYINGRKVTLNPSLLEWWEAAQECEQMNGTLLTVTDVATMNDMVINGRWIIWVGLKTNKTSNSWHSGLPVAYTNWAPSGHYLDFNSSESCISIETASPFWWTMQNCSTRLPSLCEILTGDLCEFIIQPRGGLIGFSKTFYTNTDLITCRNACIVTTEFNCQSFEYNKKRRLCQLSDTNRWEHQTKFTTNDPEWDYYHMDCYSFDVNQSLIANGWEATTMPTTEAPEKICYTLEDLSPTENETKEMETAIQELQELGTKYKDKRRTKTKESAKDDRPSATYLGTIAIVLVSCPLGLIVILDILTATPPCCKKRKKKSKKLKADKAADARSVLAQRRLMLSSATSSGTSVVTSTDTSSSSSPIEIEDVRIQIRRPVLQGMDNVGASESETLQVNCMASNEESGNIMNEPVCLNTEIEIRDTVHATLNTRDKDDHSYINAAYVNTSPILSPFYRSHSEKTTKAGFRRGHHNYSSADHRRTHRKNSAEQCYTTPMYSNFGSVDFTLWPYKSVDKYCKRSTKYGHEKFILAYGSSSAFQRDEEVESFRC